MVERQTETPGHPEPARRGPSWLPWAVAAVLALAFGIAGYSFGVQQSVGVQAGDGIRHWHFGFPFFAFFVIFWLVFLMRGLVWGWCWGPRYYRRYDAWYDDPARWDEWHRRAHEHNPPERRPQS